MLTRDKLIQYRELKKELEHEATEFIRQYVDEKATGVRISVRSGDVQFSWCKPGPDYQCFGMFLDKFDPDGILVPAYFQSVRRQNEEKKRKKENVAPS